MATAKTKIGTIHEILSTRARATFPYRVNFSEIKLAQVEEMAVWCITNCRGLWREEHYHALYFQFEDDYDAMMFMLKFGSSEGTKLK